MILGYPLFLFLSVAAVALFSFVAVATFSDARRREREAFYKSDMLKKLAESQAGGAGAALELLREQQRYSEISKRDGLRIGGLVTMAVGVGLMIFLYELLSGSQVYLCGLIPLLVGVALSAASFMPPPKL